MCLKDEYYPWNLCELSEEQEAVTWKERVIRDIWEGFTPVGFWKEVGGQPIQIEDFVVDPFAKVSWELVGVAGEIFPLSKEQVDRFEELGTASSSAALEVSQTRAAYEY
ncbi:MAG: hypothetical protein ACSHX7_03345 [Luteolibacter sp.]